MAFDPVRDAILNSPERTSYGSNPFGNDDGDENIEFEEIQGDFKAPSSANALNLRDSPERSASASASSLFYATAETPGSAASTTHANDNYQRPPLPNRQSSIFSLLSPEPQNGQRDDGRPRTGYFDDEEEEKVTAQSPQEQYEQVELDGAVKVEHDAASTTIHYDPSARELQPQLQAKAEEEEEEQIPKEPVKRGRLYQPHGRVNGPAPTSLYTPYTRDEFLYYTNHANSRNTLRKDASTSALPLESGLRSPLGTIEGKGKGREITTDGEPSVPNDYLVCPKYEELPPLHPSLVLEPLSKKRLEAGNKGSANNGGAGSNGMPSSPNKKRKRNSVSEVNTSAEGTQVAAFYNKRQNISREARTASPIIGLKSFNNWVKTVLINKFARYGTPDEPPPDIPVQNNGRRDGRNGNQGRQRRKPLKVLDMGCGKGGDLMKWQKAGLLEYVGVDIAEISVDQARGRWKDLRGPKFDAAFYVMDAFSNPLSAVVPQTTLSNPPFDVVSMQFCMHYAFQSVSKARMMLENVSRHLRPGGVFLGTIPDSAQLLERLNELPEDAKPLSFGNGVYQITFEDRSKAPAFGHRYSFYLQDAVEDVPEYVVQWDTFEQLAAEYDLKVAYHATFHELFNNERENEEFAQLLVRMKVVTPEGESELTEEQWEAANIYVAFAFVRQ